MNLSFHTKLNEMHFISNSQLLSKAYKRKIRKSNLEKGSITVHMHWLGFESQSF